MGHLDYLTLEAFFALFVDIDLHEAFEEFGVNSKPQHNYGAGMTRISR